MGEYWSGFYTGLAVGIGLFAVVSVVVGIIAAVHWNDWPDEEGEEEGWSERNP